MAHAARRVGWRLALAALLVLPAPAALGREAGSPPRRDPDSREGDSRIRIMLDAPVEFRGFDDPDTTIEEALDYLKRAYNIPFRINERAFRADGVASVGARPLGKEIPRMRNVSLRTVLRKIAERLPAPSGAVYVTGGGAVELTTGRALLAEVLGGSGRPVSPSLRPAPPAWVAAPPENVLFDERAAGPAADLLLLPWADRSPRLLSRLARRLDGWEIICLDNVIYVTTPAGAAALRKEHQAWAPATAVIASTWRPPEQESSGRPPKPTAELRQALAKAGGVSVIDEPLFVAVSRLREKTGLNLVLDEGTLARSDLDADKCRVSVVALEMGSLRPALRDALAGHGLALALVGGAAVVTREDLAAYLQLRQRVSVRLEREPLAPALRRLAQQTAVNLLIDPRRCREAERPVTLTLTQVPLDTAVRLLAMRAGLCPVRRGNVLFVTDPARAKELCREPDLLRAPPLTDTLWLGLLEDLQQCPEK